MVELIINCRKVTHTHTRSSSSSTVYRENAVRVCAPEEDRIHGTAFIVY